MTKETTTNFQGILVKIANILNKLGIVYAVTGGYAVSVWGRPRSTLDIDTLVRLSEQQVSDLVSALRQISSATYVDEEMVRQAIFRGGEFNIIDPSSGVKVDFWVGKDDTTQTQLERRVAQRVSGTDVYFLSPEDLIVSKLVWFQKSESTRHLEDIESVLAISGDRVDRNYVTGQAERFGMLELWRNILQKVSPPAPTGLFRYSHAVIAEQGPRPRMEDCHVVIDEQEKDGRLYCGVYDGHAGIEASAYARDHISKKFFERFSGGKTPIETLYEAYEAIAKEIRDAHVGTCALDLLLAADRTLWWAGVGDSRLIVVNKDNVRQLTSDHRVNNPSERKRIEHAGGLISGRYVVKGEYGLEVTRALGDEYFHDVGVISAPETGTYQLQENDRWLVVATDGLFDIMSNEEVAESVRVYEDCKSALEALKRQALINRQVQDNVTIILVRISRQ